MDPNEKIDSGASWEAVFGKLVSLPLLMGTMSRKRGGGGYQREGGHFRWAVKGTICLGLNTTLIVEFLGFLENSIAKGEIHIHIRGEVGKEALSAKLFTIAVLRCCSQKGERG
jgi:hypothetical protein